MLSRFDRVLQTGVAAILAATLLAGCGKSKSNPPAASSPNPVSLQGAVSAPGGAVAFVSPTGLQRFFAAILGSNAVAALPGDLPVSGATVNLIEINTAGTQVGAIIATATTDVSGNYTLSAPAGFVPSPKYVVRVQGSSTNLDTLVTGTSSQDVNAATDAGKTLILGTVQAAGGSLAALNVGQVESITDAVVALTKDIDPSMTGTPALLSAALASECQNQEEVINQIDSVGSTSTLNGNITNNGTALANIKVVVRDYGNWVTRATALTDSNGNYSLKLPAGDYIVGALNFTGSSTAASAWWTASCSSLCAVNNQFSAAKTTVSAGTTTRNFILGNGGRISGTVTAATGGAALAGVVIAVRDFTNDQPVAFTRTKPDGSFRLNLKPGTYTVGTRNTTLQAYGSGLYNGAATGGTVTGGGKSAAQATPISVTTGTTRSVNFALIDGQRINGIVTDGVGGSAVAGTPVRFYGDDNTAASTFGAFVDGRRTNLDGRYRFWVQPGIYSVRNRSQISSVNVSAANATQDFTAQVGRVTLTLHDASANPVSQAKVGVYDTSSNSLGFEISNADGTVDLYSAVTGNHRVDVKMDGGQFIGSSVYLNQTQLQLATNVAFTVGSSTPIDGGVTAYPVVTLAAGGELSGIVTKTGVPVANYLVQVRSGGTAGTNRFVTTRTQSDGSYSISLPAGTYDTVRACDPTNCAGIGVNSASTPVPANQTTTLNIAVP